MTRRTGRGPKARRAKPPVDVLDVSVELSGLAEQLELYPETSPRLTGGDLDADWQQAHMSGEEAVGGSVKTPDQDVVDELALALGVEEELDAPVRGVEEILAERDRHRWDLEEEAAADDDGRGEGR